MESWRDRGFVPDSDDEEEFDSQAANGDVNAGLFHDKLTAVIDGRDEKKDSDRNDVPTTDKTRTLSQSMDTDSEDELTGSARPRKDDEKQYLSISSRVGRSQQNPHLSSELNDDISLSNKTQLPGVPLSDICDVSNSSEDELQLSCEPVRRPSPDLLMNDDDSLSSLSPPPSSVHSPRLSITDKEDTQGNLQPSENKLEDLLPPLDIPEEILRELSQPTRRLLRQRNPIQLHPYLLEDARYQSLLKANGVKPVRIPSIHQQPVQGKEIQEKEFVDVPEPPSSSPPHGFQFPPSSPADPYTSPRHMSQGRTPRSEPRRNLTTSNNEDRAQKRRKLFHTYDKRSCRQRISSTMEVVIDNTAVTRDPQSESSISIPPSPPRSGSLSSADTIRADGFRFPRGFTPPALTTPPKNPKSRDRDPDDLSAHEWPEVDHQHSTAETASDAGQDLAVQEEPEYAEFEVKRLQRRIKGVLPASWLRLDLKKQEEKRPKPSQRQRDMQPGTKVEPMKGVARRVTRPKSHFAASPSHRRTAQFTFDSENSEDDLSSNANSREALAGLVGFDDPFNDIGGDDIPEDNRIDYMFPSTSRGKTTYRTRKQRPKQVRIDHTWGKANDHRPVQRRHQQRQTRITDNMPRQRTRTCSTPKAKPPKLGILDAPDVAQCARKDQPQFLRVAARQARSRQNQGRKGPDRKFFKMVTRDETEDTHKLLRDWKKGVMPQVKTPTAETRQTQRTPLGNTTSNKRNVGERRSRVTTHVASRTDSRSKWIDDPDSDLENNIHADQFNVSVEDKRLQGTTNSTKFSKPKRYGDKWVIPRAFMISSLKRNAPRPAEHERVESQNIRTPLSFRKSLAALNRTYQRPTLSSNFKPSLALDRFLSHGIPAISPVPAVYETGTTSRSAPQRRLKKRPPKRINVNEVDYHQPSSVVIEDSRAASVVSIDDAPVTDPVLQGLRNFKSSFPIDFGASPLRRGTFFHDSTFIGNGDFSRSLDIRKRNLDQDAGHSLIQMEGRTSRWGTWNDTVSSELGLVFDAISKDIDIGSAGLSTPDDRAGHAYWAVVKYVNERLCFTNPIDRTAFVDRSIILVSELNDLIMTSASINQDNWKCCLKVSSFNLVFSNQIQQVASHALVGAPKRDQSLTLVKAVAQQLLSLIFSQLGLAEIRRFIDENKIQERREVGIRDDFIVVEAYIASYHVLHSTDGLKGWFEELASSLAGDITSMKDVQELENVWNVIFTTLPLGEIDRFGIGQTGSRFQHSCGNWQMVQLLVLKILDHYDSNLTAQPASFNNYCRALFHRCFHLMTSWGWRDCKGILDTLFDFFAKNTLHNLKNEESSGSPSFLDKLDDNPSLDVQIGDSCFHILLKIIGSGLRFLSAIHHKKKITNFAWRLLPNHGRVYPKDRPLHQEDLDALRNHHDLLCTLYWAVPDGCRPRIETIRSLVDPASSHQETCSLSIRSWTRLVRFKLSTNEDISGLEPFSDWYGQFVLELARQHALARTEVESQAENIQFSRHLVESTISQNQRQIESLLSSALEGLKNAVEIARSMEQARVLVSGMPIVKLLGLFNPKLTRLNIIVKETLEVVMAYIRKDKDIIVSTATAVNDDSQEYGDWMGIEEICEDVQQASQPDATILYLEKAIQPAVSRLISNCFGEDNCPEDAILTTAVECWSSLAQALVKYRLQHWDSYLSPYGSHSWTALRETAQTKKFTPQFLASFIEKGGDFYSECRSQVLSMWMSSLVERTSVLKFQHRITEALLNRNYGSCLFKNLPFYRDRKDDRYHVTLSEFSDRRLSLISSLLSNMREHLQEIEDSGGRNLSNIREEYRDLVMTLMASMKANYQELGHSGGSAQGAYVDFVHRVVEFLQQHTQNICQIDRFFTEPTSFPLPASDPTYIVARLKSYGVRLSAGKVAKQLVMFLQSVSERAAIDGQQDYLVNQLCACMAETYENGDPHKPTLRSFLMQCVFPVYIESAFSNAAAWILSRPILQTISQTFAGLLFNIDTTDSDCTSTAINIISAIFESAQRAVHLVVDHPGFLEEPPVLVTLALFTDMVGSALLVIDYLNRTSVLPQEIIGMVRNFRQFTTFVVTTLLEPSMATDPDIGDYPSSVVGEQTSHGHGNSAESPQFFQEVQAFASRELQTWLRTSWSRHEGRYYIRRGQQVTEIENGVVKAKEIECIESAKAVFLDAAETLLGRVRHVDIFDESDGGTTQPSLSFYELHNKGDSLADFML